MHRYVIPVFFILLSACAPFHPSDERAAICNELNSRIVFNGSTSNERKADIASAEQELIQRSYQKEQCDQ